MLASRSETKRGEWKQFEGANFKVRPMGSVAYKLALVSAGLVDITFTLVPKNEWDVAAGVALVNSAGGFVSTLENGPLRCNRRDPLISGLIACGPIYVNRCSSCSKVICSRQVRAPTEGNRPLKNYPPESPPNLRTFGIKIQGCCCVLVKCSTDNVSGSDALTYLRSVADEHLATRDRSLVAENPTSIDFHVAAVTENQQLVFTHSLLLPANEFGIAGESARGFHLRPASQRRTKYSSEGVL